MATPRLAGPAARPWLALAAVLAAGIGGLHALVGGNVRQALGKLGMVGAAPQSSAGVALVAPPGRANSRQ